MIGASFSDDLPDDDVWDYASRVSFRRFVHTLAYQPRERMTAVLTQLFDPVNTDKLEDTWKTYETRVKEDMALLASEHGYRDLFELLIDAHGGNVTEKHLQYAAMHNHPAMVRIILDRLPELITKSTDALGAAVRRGFTEVARILLADPRVVPGDAVVWAAHTHNANLTKLLAADPRTSREDVAQALRTTLAARDGSAAVARVLLEHDAIPREELTKRLLMAPNPGVRRVLQDYLTEAPRPVDAALISGECILSKELGTVVVTDDGFVMLRMFEMIPEQLVAIARKHAPLWKVVAPYRWAPKSGPHVSLDKSMAMYKGKIFTVKVDWQPHAFVDYSRWVVLNVEVPKLLKCTPGGCHISIGQQRPPF